MKRIALYNIKGGVGKTTTTVNLACLLAKQGLSVLLWDLDPQGGSSYFFKQENFNDNTHDRLFDRYIPIYDVIRSTDTYQIDVIANDSKFSDQFMNKASRITALNFLNEELISNTLAEVADDYDVCIMDCSPGRFQLHQNIFKAADLLLIPNIPAPLSVHCNNMLVKELHQKFNTTKTAILCFYNMVQSHKNLHKFYINNRDESQHYILNSHIPFYAEIENITLSKESIFHQLKEFKPNIYYEKLWQEVCGRMQWSSFNITKAPVVDINNEAPATVHTAIDFDATEQFSQVAN